jgi:ribosomal protein S18 acetylase RimI-like enzyme
MTAFGKLTYLPYRIIRRFGTASVCYFFALETDQVPTLSVPKTLFVEEMSAERLKPFVDQQHGLDESHVELIRCKKAVCFAVFDQESLAAFSWVAFGSVPGELNHTGDPLTALPLSLPQNTGYVFHVLVTPEYRGRRLYGAMMSHLATLLPARGIERLVLTTEWTNASALRSVERMGFKKEGILKKYAKGQDFYIMAKVI